MRHLRTKLFLSVGILLLVVAFLNYYLPEIFVRRELNRAAGALRKHLDAIQERIVHFSSFIVTYRIAETAAELEGLSKVLVGRIDGQMENGASPGFWQLAATIASYDPKVAFVQVSGQSGETSVIAPEDAPLHVPEWAAFEQGMLWVKIPERKELFVAIPHPSTDQAATTYFLYDADSLKQNSSLGNLNNDLQKKLQLAFEHIAEGENSVFKTYPNALESNNKQGSVDQLYTSLLKNENEWVEKVDLINALALVLDKAQAPAPRGILKSDNASQRGVCLLAAEAFSQSPVITDFTKGQDARVPFFILRHENGEMDLDMVRILPNSAERKEQIVIGFSLSSMAKEIAQIAKRPVLIYYTGEFSLGFTPEGKIIELDKTIDPSKAFAESNGMIKWGGKSYQPYLIDLKVLQLMVLTPEEQATALDRFLAKLREGISKHVSLSLAGAALLSLGIALILLNGISRRITRPIVQLSAAFEELGKGKYEGLVLPSVENRKDEIAVLTHSFKKMVGALIDRDKIRGVLNKVVSKEISEEILRNKIELGGEERVLTMFFSDIRGFTHLSEDLEPHVLIGLLNTYMTRMCRIIDETKGVVDKFVGDEIMALYGAPLPLEDHAVKAIEAAASMLTQLRVWNEESRLKGEIPFEIGIGIHTGLVCVGNMGAENRLNYTVIGANVNLAARLCSQAKSMQIIVSEETWKQPGVQERFSFRPLEPLTLKGIDQPVKAYELIISS